jgi:hypothetical protein
MKRVEEKYKAKPASFQQGLTLMGKIKAKKYKGKLKWILEVIKKC